MSRKAQENLVAICLLAILVGFLVLGAGYGRRARMVPVPVAVASVVLLLAQVLLQNTRKDVDLTVNTMDLFVRKGAETVEVETAGERERTREPGGKEWVGFLIVAVFLVLMLLLGLMPAVLLFVFGYFLFVGKRRWYVALGYSVINGALTYLLFSIVLKIHMYEGVLGAAIRGSF